MRYRSSCRRRTKSTADYDYDFREVNLLLLLLVLVNLLLVRSFFVYFYSSPFVLCTLCTNCVIKHTNKMPSSHTRTVVRQCDEGDEASQWKRPTFDPSPHKNPLTDLH